MGYNVVGAALKHYPHGGNKKLVLLAIAENANVESWLCWPSIETIARCSCQSTRSVSRLVKELEAEGILEVRRFPGKRKSNVYRVRVDRLEAMPTLLKTPVDVEVSDMFDPIPSGNTPVDKGVGKPPKSVDNPVDTDSHLSSLRVPNCPVTQDTAVSDEPLRTVKKPNNSRLAEFAKNSMKELEEKFTMTND